VVVFGTPLAHAETYTYMCKIGHGRVSPVTVNEDNALTWRGEVYKNLTVFPDCRAAWTATRNGVTAKLCTATQGVATLTIGKDDFDCQMPDNPSRQVYREWLRTK
jgi:hypothetical protein